MTQTELDLAPARTSSAPPPEAHAGGAGWLGDVPMHWKVKRLKRLGRLTGGAGFPITEQGVSDEEIPFYKVSDMTSEGHDRLLQTSPNTVSRATARRLNAEVFPDRTIIFPKVGAALLTNKRRQLDGPGCVDNNIMAFVPKSVDSDFAYYALSSVDLSDLANPGAVPSVTGAQVGQVELAVPPLDEQRVIAAYLDRETERIDDLVARKRQHLRLLDERREALVTRAVTRGLDPDAPLAASGVESLGEIPAHWDVKPLMRLTPDRRQIMYGIVLPGPHVEDGVPIVKAGSVAPGRLRLDKLRRTDPEIEAGYVRSRLRPGDVVYAIRGSIGGAEMVPDELDGANLTQDAARIAPADDVFGPWLLYAVKSKALFAQLEAGALGTAVKGINIRDLKRGKVPVPPVEEQRAIAAHLDRETARLRQLAAKVKESVQRLREYRAALITAAVTGRVRVSS